jgi:hypothetical protein
VRRGKFADALHGASAVFRHRKTRERGSEEDGSACRMAIRPEGPETGVGVAVSGRARVRARPAQRCRPPPARKQNLWRCASRLVTRVAVGRVPSPGEAVASKPPTRGVKTPRPQSCCAPSSAQAARSVGQARRSRAAVLTPYSPSQLLITPSPRFARRR